MKNTKKIVALVLAIVLICAASVMGTIAYLNSKTAEVENTFTVGDVKITLDEADVDKYGNVEKKDDGTLKDRVIENNYTIIPGHTYTKDPVIHVDENSENCWVFVKVVNELAEIETTEVGKTIDAQIKANGWTALDGVAGVYYKQNVTAGTDLATFAQFTVDPSKDAAAIKAFDNKTINVTGYAIQSMDVATADDAAEAFGLK